MGGLTAMGEGKIKLRTAKSLRGKTGQCSTRNFAKELPPHPECTWWQKKGPIGIRKPENIM